MPTPSPVRVRRGTNLDLYFDSFTDDTMTTRIDYDGWRFTVSYATAGQPDLTWATDDPTPAVTVVDATEGPSGKHLAFHLDSTDVSSVFTAGGTLTLLRIDPLNPSNVQPLTDPVPVNVAASP